MAKAATKAWKPRRVANHPGHHLDGTDSVLVLQFSQPNDQLLDESTDPDQRTPSNMDSFAAHVIANALRAVRARPNKDKPWLLFVADFRPGALCNWIGISGNAPASFVDALQRELGAYQCESHRELARIAPYSLRPLMAISSDGIEIATGGGIERTTLDRLTPTPVRVPFSVSLQAAMQNALMSQRVNALPRAHVHRWLRVLHRARRSTK